jgi:hypothetical protein
LLEQPGAIRRQAKKLSIDAQEIFQACMILKTQLSKVSENEKDLFEHFDDLHNASQSNQLPIDQIDIPPTSFPVPIGTPSKSQAAGQGRPKQNINFNSQGAVAAAYNQTSSQGVSSLTTKGQSISE